MWLRALTVVLVLLPATALARLPADEAKEHFVAANKLFNLARYDEAIKEFEAAYQAVEDPAFIYNLAQAHRLAGHLEQGIRFYRNYLRLDPNTSVRADIEKRIDEMEKALAVQKRQEVAPPSGTINPGQQPVPEPRAPSTTARATSPGGRALKIAGVALAAAGVAIAVGGGVGFGLAAQDKADAIRAQALAVTKFDPTLDDARQLDRTLAIVSYAAGGAIAVVGVVLLVLGVRSGGERAVTVAPMVAPGSAGLAVGGAF